MYIVYQNKTTQQGAVLTISMIFLVILTLLGVSSMRSTVLEEKMAGNYKSCQVAFQSAEAAMRSGEAWIQSQTERPPTSASDQIGSNVWNLNASSPVVDQPNWWDQVDSSWWENSNNATTYTDVIKGTAAVPAYVREEQTFIKDSLTMGIPSDNAGRVFYRITARGVGATGQTKSILQSTYTRRF